MGAIEGSKDTDISKLRAYDPNCLMRWAYLGSQQPLEMYLSEAFARP